MIPHEELRAKYPPDDRDEYQQEYAKAGLEGDIVELFYTMRTHAGLTQAELADLMGTTESAIAELEDFVNVPTVEMLSRLSHATGIPLRLVAFDLGEVDLGGDRTADR